MKYKESDLQIRCIKWFRYQFPAYARLMEHPKNEGNGNRRQGSIAKAEGVQAGVADLILHVPSFDMDIMRQKESTAGDIMLHSLAVEMKTKKGCQSREQKQWQRYFEAAGGKYIIIRSYDDFVDTVSRYLHNVPATIANNIQAVHAQMEREADEEARAQFQKLLKKQ